MRLGFFAFIFAMGSGFAQSFLALDSVLTHGADAATRPVMMVPLRAIVPDNWIAPVDYSKGLAHVRLEVVKKYSTTLVKYRLCLEQTGTVAATACVVAPTFADTGVTMWSLPLAQWTGATGMDWTRKPQRLQCTMQDNYGTAIDSTSNKWVGMPYLALYYPLQVRISIMVLAPGETFPGWSLAPTGIQSRVYHSRAMGGRGEGIHAFGTWFRSDRKPTGRDALGRYIQAPFAIAVSR